MLKTLMLLAIAAVTQQQAQQACDDADKLIAAQRARLAQEQTALADYQAKTSALEARFLALIAKAKMDAFDRSAYLTSWQGPLFNLSFGCECATDGLDGGKGMIGAGPQLAYAKQSLAAQVWDVAWRDANTATGFATDVSSRFLDKCAAQHPLLDAAMAKANALLTKYGG